MSGFFEYLMSKIKILIAISVLVLSMLACNALIPPQPTNTPQPTFTSQPAMPTALIPLTEDEVPRVSVEDAKAAFDSGSAIIVDVRSAQAFQSSHIPGAINIQLGEFETNPTELDLPKDQWIITYCT